MSFSIKTLSNDAGLMNSRLYLDIISRLSSDEQEY